MVVKRLIPVHICWKSNCVLIGRLAFQLFPANARLRRCFIFIFITSSSLTLCKYIYVQVSIPEIDIFVFNSLNDMNCYISVNGGWGDWSDYGGCTGNCGTGAQTRTRVCDNPIPQHGGADCLGEPESIPC